MENDKYAYILLDLKRLEIVDETEEEVTLLMLQESLSEREALIEQALKTFVVITDDFTDRRIVMELVELKKYTDTEREDKFGLVCNKEIELTVEEQTAINDYIDRITLD